MTVTKKELYTDYTGTLRISAVLITLVFKLM